ncbi:MAG: cytochrome c peroxidase [Steroidobacteraceae bacterium]
MSWSKVALGRRLFFDPRLSAGGRLSCASCHAPERAFTDARGVSRGALGDVLARNAMSLGNVAYNASYGWVDPKLRSLEAQMQQPLFNEHPIEMGLAGRVEEVLTVLETDSDYPWRFREAFADDPRPISMDNLVRAIACYERTLITGNSPFDQYVFRGEHDALDPSARRGLALFYSKRLGCAVCHAGFNFTGTWTQSGRDRAPPAFADNGSGGAYRVPTLRNVALTAPYMHDGRFQTLNAVISHYESSAGRGRLRRFRLTATERDDLIAFLNSLTDAVFIEQQLRP